MRARPTAVMTPRCRSGRGSQRCEALNAFRQLDEELSVALQMVNPVRVISHEAGHRLEALPVRDGDEFALVLAILPQRLNTERLLD